MSRQVAKRQNQAIIAAPLGVAALRALVQSRGAAWVAERAASGALRATESAWKWYTSVPATVKNDAITIANAPTSSGVTLRGAAGLNGSIRVRSRENIARVDTNTTLVWRVNPAAMDTFPNLSTIAGQYDRYKVHSMNVVVVSSVPTTTAGRWMLAFDPDSSDRYPASTPAFMTMKDSMSCSSWQSASMPIKPSGGFKLCSMWPDADKDVGSIFFYASGSSPQYDIYVEYDITLSDPQLGGAFQSAANGSSTWLATGSIGGTGTPIARSSASPAGRRMDLPPGRYIVALNTFGTSITTAGWTISPYPNGFGDIRQRYIVNSAGTEAIHTAVIQNDSGVIVNCNGGGSVTNWVLTITPIDQATYQFIYTW